MIPDWRILGPLMAGLVALFGWLAKHISNTKKHPCKDDIVYKDVCKSERKRIDDCLEGAERRTEQRFKEVKEDMHRGFDEVKELIRSNGRRC